MTVAAQEFGPRWAKPAATRAIGAARKGAPVERGERDAAFTAFARERGPALTRTAFFLTGDRHLAEDLVQTTLAEIYVRWPSLADPAAYARRALVSANAAWWRRRSASEIPTDAAPDMAGPDTTAAVADRAPVVEALRLLPARQRAALVLRFYDDLSEADTALAMGCSAGSVKRHTARGLDRLRKLVDGESLGIRVGEVEPSW